jgi:Methane oxygenase PmoA
MVHGFLALALLPALAPGKPADVTVAVGKDRIDFSCGSELATSYVIDPAQAKPFFWPLNGPGGAVVTRGWPVDKAEPGEMTDHVHHKSVWFCHGDVIPEGMELKHKIKGVAGVDFWSETPGHGVIACTKVEPPEVKGNHARVVTLNEWRTADGEKVLDETRTIHFVDFGDARLIVVDSDLDASVVPVTFGDTKEGSFGIRVRKSVTEQKGKGTLTNAEGKTHERDVWGRVSEWCDYSGPVGDTTAGIALFADPTNPVPTYWHSRAYGLMAANPFGREKSGFPAARGRTDLVRLSKGAHLKLRYGILVHTGDVKEGKVAEYYRRFIDLKQ